MPIEEDIVVGEIPKNNREDIRVTLSNFKGHDLVGARIWFKTKDGESRPSSKGITVNVRVLPELIGLLEEAEKKAIELGVLSPDDGPPPPPEPGDEPPF
jgi:Transcriptional Coactivator p15 (PC4)